MEVIYALIPASLLVGLIAIGWIIWAVKNKQFKDLDGEAGRILKNDDEE